MAVSGKNLRQRMERLMHKQAPVPVSDGMLADLAPGLC